MREGSPLERCRVCDGTRFGDVLDLGLQPWCNDFRAPQEAGREPRYPLRLVFCHDCATAQLDYTVPKEVMFRDHTYVSGTTATLSRHFRGVAEQVDAALGPRSQKSVLDIGSNDGTQLKQFRELDYEVLGIESAKTPAALARASGIDTLETFFDAEVARTLRRRFDVVNAAGVFFHLEDLHSVADGIREVLREDGIFVVQFLYMKRIVEHGAFDQIYHEHLLYYTLTTLDRLLRRHQLSIFDAYAAPIHGGSLVAYAGHDGQRAPTRRLDDLMAEEETSRTNCYETYRRFADNARVMRDDNRKFVDERRRQGKRIFGLGAPAKGNTLLNYFGFGPDDIECLVERNPLRRGLVSPGTHIPIVLESDVGDPDVYYVLAWNFRDEILARYADARARGVEFYFPIDES